MLNLYRALHAMRIPTLSGGGLEADDLIAGLAREAAAQGWVGQEQVGASGEGLMYRLDLHAPICTLLCHIPLAASAWW